MKLILEKIHNHVEAHSEYPMIAIILLVVYLLGAIAFNPPTYKSDDIIPILTEDVMETCLREGLCEHCVNNVMYAYRVAYKSERSLTMDISFTIPRYELYLYNLVGTNGEPFHCTFVWDLSDKRWCLDDVMWSAPCLAQDQVGHVNL